MVDPSAGGACTRFESPLNWNQQGPQGPQGPQGHPGIDATNLIRGKGVTSTWSSTLFPGVYRLTFDRNISQCALSATLGSDSVADYGEVSALIDTGNPAQVMVFTRTVQDDLAGHGDHTAKPFFLEVFC